MPENNQITSKKKNRRPLYESVCLAMLTALYVVLNRFLSISTSNINLGFAFVATVTAAALFSIHGGMLVGGLGDLIGAILFPKGAYFPGFTLSAVLIGAIYGVCLKRSRSFWSIALAAILSQTVSSLLLNSLWVSLLYGSPFKAAFTTRLPQFFAVTVLQLVISPIIVKVTRVVEREAREFR